MHSAIFSVVDVTDKDVDKIDIDDLPLADGDKLYEWMDGHADYVRDESCGWEPEELTRYLSQRNYIKSENKDTFEIADGDEYIRKELVQRAEAIKEFAETTDYGAWTMHFTARQILDDTSGFYIALVSEKYGLEELSSVDSFLLGGMHSGKKYKIVAVNDYHF